MDDLTLSDYVERSKNRILASLVDWLRIPSMSADPDHAEDVAASAEFCAGLMRSAGIKNVEVLSAGGVPAVYGDWLDAGAGAPTVLVYGHHDVQPVTPSTSGRPRLLSRRSRTTCCGRGAPATTRARS